MRQKKKVKAETKENSWSREFWWELASFYLARPWEIIFYFSLSSRNTRLKKRNSRLEVQDWKKEILVLVSKNEIFIQISREKKTYHFKKFWEINSRFLKISINKQATNVIPKNSRENCLNLDSRSRLEARDWKKKFSSRSTRLRERNSHSRLEHEIERKKFSFPSRELK